MGSTLTLISLGGINTNSFYLMIGFWQAFSNGSIMGFIDPPLLVFYFQKSFQGHHWSVNTCLGVYFISLSLIKLDVDMFMCTLCKDFSAIFLYDWMGHSHGSCHIFKPLKQGWACCVNWYSKANNSPYSNRLPKQLVLPDWHKDSTFHFLLNKSFQF